MGLDVIELLDPILGAYRTARGRRRIRAALGRWAAEQGLSLHGIEPEKPPGRLSGVAFPDTASRPDDYRFFVIDAVDAEQRRRAGLARVDRRVASPTWEGPDPAVTVVWLADHQL